MIYMSMMYMQMHMKHIRNYLTMRRHKAGILMIMKQESRLQTQAVSKSTIWVNILSSMSTVWRQTEQLRNTSEYLFTWEFLTTQKLII